MNRFALVSAVAVPFLGLPGLSALVACSGTANADVPVHEWAKSTEEALRVGDVVALEAATLLSTIVEVEAGSHATALFQTQAPATASALSVKFSGCDATPSQVQIASTAGGALVGLVPQGEGVFATADAAPTTVAYVQVFYRARTAGACSLVVKTQEGGGGGGTTDAGTPAEPPPSTMLLTRLNVPAGSSVPSQPLGLVFPQSASRLRVTTTGCSATVTGVQIVPATVGVAIPETLGFAGSSEWGTTNGQPMNAAGVVVTMWNPAAAQCALLVENASPGAPPSPGTPILQVLLTATPAPVLQSGFLTAQNPLAASSVLVDLRECPGVTPTGVDVAAAGGAPAVRLNPAGANVWTTFDGRATGIGMLNLFASSSVRATCKLTAYVRR